MKKIESLTKEQITKFPEYVDKWLKIGLSTAPIDKERASRAIDAVYECVGLKTPKIKIWLDSPYAGCWGSFYLKEVNERLKGLTGAQVWAQVRAQVGAQVGDQVRDQVRAQVWDQVGDQVRDQVGDQVRDQVGAQVRDQVWDQVRDQVWDQVGDQVRDQVGAQVRDQVWDQVRDQVWDQVGDQVRAQVGDQVGAQVGDQVGAQVRDQRYQAAYGSQDANWLGFYNYFQEQTNLKVCDKLNGLMLAASELGWFFPFENAVIITPRPIEIKRDRQNRLHCKDGMALKYPDGWGIYAWHGIRIPAWIIENPEKITIRNITDESNSEIKRIMINKYGAARYLEDIVASVIDRDRDTKGERILYSGQVSNIVIKIIKLENSTPEKDGSKKWYTFRVPPTIKTCQEAVAWMYGREPNLYKPQIET